LFSSSLLFDNPNDASETCISEAPLNIIRNKEKLIGGERGLDARGGDVTELV
jgi:hypothetical protein